MADTHDCQSVYTWNITGEKGPANVLPCSSMKMHSTQDIQSSNDADKCLLAPVSELLRLAIMLSMNYKIAITCTISIIITSMHIILLLS